MVPANHSSPLHVDRVGQNRAKMVAHAGLGPAHPGFMMLWFQKVTGVNEKCWLMSLSKNARM